jgi:hypothetical protein
MYLFCPHSHERQGLVFPMRHRVLLPNPLYYNSELGHRPLCAMPLGDHGLAVPSTFESWFAQAASGFCRATSFASAYASALASSAN